MLTSMQNIALLEDLFDLVGFVHANNACSPGSSKNATGTCSSCAAGTYSLTGSVCTPCQKGTASNVAGSITSCPPCPAGSFSSGTSSSNCSSCPSSSNCQVGSFSSTRAYSPVSEVANQTEVDKNGQTVQVTASPVSGWIYFGIFLGCVVLSGVILIPLRRRLRQPVSAISVILRTPFSFFRIVPSSWTVIEIPSFYRGLVALWVIFGVIVVTAYQSEVFVNDGVVSLSSVQPGSTFTNKNSTSTAEATFSVSLVLYQTPISCNSSQFTLQVVASDTTSTGSLGTLDCVEDASLPSLNISVSFPAALSFSSTSSVSLLVTAASESPGSPLFTHGVSYQLLLGNYGATCTQMSGTVTNNTNNQLTCDVTVFLSAVPTEYLNEDLSTAGTGYTFSYFSSSAPALSIPSSSTLQVAFNLPVPENYYQIKQVQNISGLQFVVGLISLAGGVLTVGSILGNAGAYLRQRWKANKSQSKIDTPNVSHLMNYNQTTYF